MEKLEKNEGQEQAIQAVDGPVVIIAAPGSGKTTTLVRRIHHMVTDLGVSPKNILMTTFSNNAAKDMEERYVKLFGPNPGIWFCTLHSLSFNILRKAGVYDVNDILKEFEAHDFIFNFLKNVIKAENAWDLASNVATDITVIKGNNIDPYDRKYDPNSMEKGAFLKVYRAYEDMKTQKHKIDFDDMLIECYKLLLLPERRAYLEAWQRQFPYIICDEYQDTNYIQRDILYLLAGETRNICVVGDDDQSIYRFRGARSEIMRNFEKDQPGCLKINIGINYRSGQNIVNLCDRLIKPNKNRFKKEFVSWRGQNDSFEGLAEYHICDGRDKEFGFILSKIKSLKESGVPYEDMAVLVRTNEMAGHPVMVFSKENIPFHCTVRVKSKYEDFIFRDLSAYIRLSAGIANQKDFGQVLNHPSRFLREKEMRKATQYTEASLCMAATYLLKDLRDGNWKYNRAEESIRMWMDSFGPGKVSLEDTPAKAFRALEDLGYMQYIGQYAEFRKLDKSEFMEQYKELQKDAEKCRTIREWFDMAEEEIKLYEEFNRHKNTQGVTISTFHKSKGQEYKIVFVTGVEKGVVPHKKSQRTTAEIEEERRCFYVACSRAADQLYITCPSPGEESPFMFGIKPASAPKKENKNVRPGTGEQLYLVYSTMRRKNGIMSMKAEGKMHILFGESAEDTPEDILTAAGTGEFIPEESWKHYPEDVISGEIKLIKAL